MKNVTIVFLLIVLSQTTILAQESRIPYLSQGKYGVVDQKGKKIIPYDFDDVVIDYKFNVIKLLKNDLWAIYNMDGKPLLDHLIKNTKNFGSIGPVIREMKNQLGIGGYKTNPPTNLVSIIDSYAKVKYFVNPNSPSSSSKAYKERDKKSNHALSFSYYPIENNYTVTNRDGSMNVIDSTGKEMLPNSVEEAYVLSDEFVTVGKNNLFALFKNYKKVTEYKYKNFKQLDVDGVIYGIFEEKNDKGYTRKKYHLFDKNGKVLNESEKYFTAANEMLIASDKEGHSHVYDGNMTKINTFENCIASWFVVGSNTYIMLKGRNRSGIYNTDGSVVLDSIYSYIQSSYRHVHCVQRNTHTVLDSNFNMLIECDTVTSLKGTKQEGIFMFSKDGPNYRSVYGLMDTNQKTIIPAEWNSVFIYPCVDYALLLNDSLSVLKRMSDGKVIGRSGKNGIKVDCSKEQFEIIANGQKITKDFDGNILKTYTFSSRNSSSEITTKYKAKKIGKKYVLVDQNESEVTPKKYESIEILTDPKTGKTAYFCVFAENVHPSCIIFDDALNEIGQLGYSLPERWVRYMKINKGTIFVANDADIAKNKYQFKSGIIDYEGNWIVNPFLGYFKFIDRDVFLVINYDSKKHEFYNSKGKITNKGDYDIIQDRSGSDYFQNRIPVGILQDRSYIDKLNNVTKDLDNSYDKDEPLEKSIEKLKKNNEKIKAIGEPDILFGYVNKFGEEIISPKYIAASCFDMSDPYAIVSEKDKEGNISTQIIDTLGNIKVSVPYESLYEIYDGYYSCKSNGYYGLVDSTGSAKTPFIFTKITRGIKQFNTFIAEDSTQHYVIDDNFKIHPIEKSNDIILKKINDDYFYVQLKFKIPDTYTYNFKHILYSKNMELIDSFENIQDIKVKFNGVKLSPNYLAIIKKDMPKVVYNISNRALLEN